VFGTALYRKTDIQTDLGSTGRHAQSGRCQPFVDMRSCLGLTRLLYQSLTLLAFGQQLRRVSCRVRGLMEPLIK
jgi:hypothetical protein